MVNGRLAGADVNRGVLEQHLRRDVLDEIERVPDGDLGERCQRLPFLHQGKCLIEVEAVRVDGRPVLPGGDAVHLEGYPVFLFELALFALQQARQGASDVAETEQGETIMGHIIPPYTGGYGNARRSSGGCGKTGSASSAARRASSAASSSGVR